VIKEKCDKSFKGRICADSRKQREWYTKQKRASLTLHTESFMITTAIEAKKRWDVVTTDIKGAYFHALQDNFTVVKFVNKQVDIMTIIDKKYKKYAILEGRNKLLYLILSKALYDTVRALLLWYNLLTETLIGLGFKLNP